MMLAQIISEYVTLKQSLGMRFRTESRTLKSFNKAMGDIDITQVTLQSVESYLAGSGPITTFWHRKFEALSGFYRYVVTRGHIAVAPLPLKPPKRPRAFKPYIFSLDEIRKLAEITGILDESRRYKIQSATFRTLLLLLYGTGLRISEALSLTLTDVDLSGRLLTIRDTKFYKTRWVPLGPQLNIVLIAYSEFRRRLPHPFRNDSAFLSTRRGEAMKLPD